MTSACSRPACLFSFYHRPQRRLMRGVIRALNEISNRNSYVFSSVVHYVRICEPRFKFSKGYGIFIPSLVIQWARAARDHLDNNKHSFHTDRYSFLLQKKEEELITKSLHPTSASLRRVTFSLFAMRSCIIECVLRRKFKLLEHLMYPHQYPRTACVLCAAQWV